MKPQFPISFLLLAAACGGSSAPPEGTASTPPPTTMAAPSPMGPSIVADVVTIDTAAPSVTLREGDVPPTRSPRPKDLKPGDRTIRVEPAAAGSLSAIKPGDRVRVTCSAPRPVVVTGASPMMGGASPASGMASPGMTATASPGAMGATGALAQCDSVVAITLLTATPMMTPAP